jgi:molecular chaperone IbpA
MTNSDPFGCDQFSRFLLGGDRILETFQKAQQAAKEFSAASNWPPYNIVKVDQDKYVIEMAVAGFPKGSIDLEFANGSLIVTGSVSSDGALVTDDKDSPFYIYKGIAQRPFTRKFELSDTVEIKNAELVNGMLKVWIENIIPEGKAAKKIEIKDHK